MVSNVLVIVLLVGVVILAVLCIPSIWYHMRETHKLDHMDIDEYMQEKAKQGLHYSPGSGHWFDEKGNIVE